MEGKANIITVVLLIIIAFLTLTLAALAGYVFIGANSSKNENPLAETQTQSIKIPNDDELALMMLYGEDPALLNLKSDDVSSSTPPVIKVSIEIEYFKKVKGIKVEEKLATYHSRIKELVSTYFQNMTLDEAKDPETKEKASRELTQKINELLNSNEKNGKKVIIYDIVFDEWFYT